MSTFFLYYYYCTTKRKKSQENIKNNCGDFWFVYFSNRKLKTHIIEQSDGTWFKKGTRHGCIFIIFLSLFFLSTYQKGLKFFLICAILLAYIMY